MMADMSGSGMKPYPLKMIRILYPPQFDFTINIDTNKLKGARKRKPIIIQRIIRPWTMPGLFLDLEARDQLQESQISNSSELEPKDSFGSDLTIVEPDDPSIGSPQSIQAEQFEDFVGSSPLSQPCDTITEQLEAFDLSLKCEQTDSHLESLSSVGDLEIVSKPSLDPFEFKFSRQVSEPTDQNKNVLGESWSERTKRYGIEELDGNLLPFHIYNQLDQSQFDYGAQKMKYPIKYGDKSESIDNNELWYLRQNTTTFPEYSEPRTIMTDHSMQPFPIAPRGRPKSYTLPYFSAKSCSSIMTRSSKRKSIEAEISSSTGFGFDQTKIEESSNQGGSRNYGQKKIKIEPVTKTKGPKPKQIRYRTERPFTCPHCPGTFTLRSNMERHGKQQHPLVWLPSPSVRAVRKRASNNGTNRWASDDDNAMQF